MGWRMQDPESVLAQVTEEVTEAWERVVRAEGEAKEKAKKEANEAVEMDALYAEVSRLIEDGTITLESAKRSLLRLRDMIDDSVNSI